MPLPPPHTHWGYIQTHYGVDILTETGSRAEIKVSFKSCKSFLFYIFGRIHGKVQGSLQPPVKRDNEGNKKGGIK